MCSREEVLGAKVVGARSSQTSSRPCSRVRPLVLVVHTDGCTPAPTYSNHRICVLGRSVYCICATNLAGSSHAQANMSTMEGRLAELLVSAVSGAGDTVAVPVLEYARHVLLLSWERSERSCACQCVRILGCVGGDLSVHTCVRGPCKMLPQ